MGEKTDLEAFHEQITISDFLGFLLSHNLRLQGKSGWSPCKNVTARILIHSNTDVWLSKYFYQTQSLGFTFAIPSFQCWWWSHGSEWSVCMPRRGTNQAINQKSYVISLLTKLKEGGAHQQGAAAVNGRSLAIKIWRERRNFPHFYLKAS